MAYKGDADLRGSDQAIAMTPEELENYTRCAVDIIFFAEEYCKITTLDDGIITVKLFDYQKRILKAIVETPENKRHLLLKLARQSGKTTIILIYVLWYSIFNQHKDIGLLANTEKLAKKNLTRYKFMYRKLPLWLQQGVTEWNKLSVGLSNGVNVVVGATTPDSISGYAISLLILDEFAKVPDHMAEEFIMSAMPTISSGTTSQVIILSTPKGLNHYYTFWEKAVAGISDYYPISIPYWERPGRNDPEWKRKEIENIGIVGFRQEYMCQFVGSSVTLLDPDAIEGFKFISPITDKYAGALQIYEKPQYGAKYILGVDVSKGIGADYSVIQVLKFIDTRRIQQVAVFRSNTIKPSKFAEILDAICRFYNNAYMMVESQDAGQIVVTKLYEEFENEYLISENAKHLGIFASKKNKGIATLLLKDYIEEGYLKIVDRNTIGELSRYEEVRPDIFKCRSGNDDCVTSIMWGVYFMEMEELYEYDDGDYGDYEDDDRDYTLDELMEDDDAPSFAFSS